MNEVEKKRQKKGNGFLDYCKNNVVKASLLFLYVALCLASMIHFFVIKDVMHALLSLLFSLVPVLVFPFERFHILKVSNFLVICLFLLCIGGLLGTSYNMYMTVPFLDSILHLTSGVIFGLVGYEVARLFFKDDGTGRSFAGCLLFAFSFTLAVGLVWELIEFGGTTIFGLDMQEDGLVKGFNSYYVSGTHDHPDHVDDIVRTVIYYGNGKTLTIEGGYLDIGLFDTIIDMFLCLFGAIGFLLYQIVYFLIKRKKAKEGTNLPTKEAKEEKKA